MASIVSVIRKNIRDATITAFGLSDIPIIAKNVIFSHGGGTEPSGNYCVINILENRQKGRAEEATRTRQGETRDEQSLASTVYYYAKVQFTFLGKDAAELGTEFHHNLNNNRQVIEWYQRASLAPVNKSDLKRLPKLRETDWVETAVVDLDFAYSVQRYQDIDWVEYFILNGITYKITNDD